MGPRDPDDWQFFGGKVPADVDVNAFDRVTDRRFFGSYKYRTIQVDEDYVLTKSVKKQKKDKGKRFQERAKKLKPNKRFAHHAVAWKTGLTTTVLFYKWKITPGLKPFALLLLTISLVTFFVCFSILLTFGLLLFYV